MSIAPADLFLSAQLTEEEACRFLARIGFRDPARADRQLQALAAELSVREALANLAATLLEALSTTADPDAALSAFVHYVSTRSPAAGFLRYLAEDPRALGVLIEVTGSSAMLTDLLIASPESFHWLVREIDRCPPDAWELAEEVDRRLTRAGAPAARRDVLRQFKERETLRIAARALLRRDSLDDTGDQLSALTQIVVGRALWIARGAVSPNPLRSAAPGRFCVIALDRSASPEVDYAAAAELIYIADAGPEDSGRNQTFFNVLGQMLTAVLAGDEGERPLQRVHHPRWFGQEEGAIVRSLASCVRDRALTDNPTARASLSNARPIAGDLELGRQFLERVALSPPPTAPAFDACRTARKRRSSRNHVDIKRVRRLIVPRRQPERE